MERWVKRTMEFAAGLAFTGKSNPSVIPYYPQKTEISGDERQYFHRTTPEKKGVSSGRLLAMVKAMEKNKRCNVHSILCVKDGEVILECSHPGYNVNMWHLSHSMSKTVTSIAVGMLADDGVIDLDSPVHGFFPEIVLKDKGFEKITVRHLLTMSSGVNFSEAGSVTETKWTDAFFSSTLAFEPGTEFTYNSMNSYILARIVVKASGKSLVEFLDERLFGPLQITNRFWEKSAEGYEKGGWGLYLSAESWAKIGYMMLSCGTFEGRRIVSERWVRESIVPRVKTPDTIGRYDYGYHLWVSRDGENVLFNGMLGQNVWICPKNRLLVVVLSGNNELFQNSPTLSIIEQYLNTDLYNDISESCFGGDVLDLHSAERHFFESRHWIRPYVQKRSISERLTHKNKNAYPKEWNNIIGKYQFAKNNCGVVPLIVRGMQNNFKSSVDSIEFERDGNRIFFTYTECGTPYRMEVGFSDFEETVIDLHGEKYIARVMGEAMEDEDRNMLYKVEVVFPELPNTRFIKLSFVDDDVLLVRMSEMPSEKIAHVFMNELDASNPRLVFFRDMIEKRVGKNFADNKLRETFAPRLTGARRGSEGYAGVMDAEREKLKISEKNNRIIDTIVDKFLRDDDDEDIAERSFFVEIIDRIKARIPQKQKADCGGKAKEGSSSRNAKKKQSNG